MFSFSACKRRIIHAEFHRNCRLFDIHIGKWFSVGNIRNCITDMHIFKTGKCDNFAGCCLCDFFSLHAFIGIHFSDSLLFNRTIGTNKKNRITGFHSAFLNSSNSDTTDIITPIKSCDNHLEWTICFNFWRWNFFDNFL